MELRQLKYFSAVAKQLSFTKAATTLFVSQSAISQQISALESELGIQLLVRDKHAVSLTQAGAELYENLQGILGSLDDAVESAQITDRARHYAARMTLGIQDQIEVSGSLSPLVRALQETQDQFPFLIVDILRIPFDQVEPSLTSGRADAVVSLDPAGIKAPFSKVIFRRALFREKLMLSVSKKLLRDQFPDGRPDVRTLLQRYTLNTADYDAGLVQQIFAIYRHHDLLPNIRYFDNPMESMLRARLGFGLSLTPETLLHESGNDEFMEYFDLDTDAACVTRNLLWREDHVSDPLRFLLGRLWPDGAAEGATTL